MWSWTIVSQVLSEMNPQFQSWWSKILQPGVYLQFQCLAKGLAVSSQRGNCITAICLLGHRKVVLKTDGEPAIIAVSNSVKERCSQVDIIPENSVTGDSASNGEAENANKLVQNQIRTMYDALKARFSPLEVPSDHPTLKWLIMFSGSLLTRFMVGSDGKTAFEREKGKRYKRALPEFGERIHFMPLKKSGSKLNKLEPRLKDGIFLGLR